MRSVYTSVGLSGVSKYFKRFQSVLNRSTAIAAVPVKALISERRVQSDSHVFSPHLFV